MVAFVAPIAAQTPTAPKVASGSVGITQNGVDTVVKQDSSRAIVDWRSFSVGPNASVRFDQPSTSSVILNRVTGPEVSRIDGNISAIGQVWLANPNGTVIGPSGQVNVGGLLMTTGRVDELVFLRSGGATIDQIARDAKIVNQGAVTVAEGGYAALAAAAIKNEGAIVARKGDVAFGAGRAMTLDFAGDKLITFQVTQPLDQAPVGSDTMIGGAGAVNAAGGSVVMSARAAKGVMDTVINLKGHLVADRVRVDGGTVTFGDGGVVQVAGKIDASATEGVGGRVEVLGPKIGLMEGASIDASGAGGGGTVLIGGDWQGKGAIQNAEVAYVATGVSINVDATRAGPGGKVVVWADDTTRFDGMISARGGVAGGDGGQVETSGKRSLLVGENTTVTTEARVKGWRTGDWLLDPTDIEITDVTNVNMTKVAGLFMPATSAVSKLAGTTIATQLKTTSVIVQTSNPGKGLVGGNINVTGAITTTKANPATLTLIADDNITISDTIRLKFPDQHLVLIAGAQATTQAAVNGYVKLDGNIFTEGGSVTMGGGVNGKFALQSPIGGALLGNGGIVTTTGAVTIRGQGDPNVAGASSIGVEVDYINAGAINIEGIGGKAAGGSAAGVVANRVISRFAGGSITIKGTGGAGSGTNSEGVRITQSAEAYEGPVVITGIGGSIGENQGVLLEGATISSGATATIKGTAGSPNGAEGVKIIKNVTSGDDSKLTIGQWDDVTDVSYMPSGGSLIIEGVGGSRSGVSSVSMANTLIDAMDGALTIKGTDLSGGGANATGVTLGANSAITTSTGSINISGAGSSTGASNAGVKLSGGTITATGKGGSIKIDTPGGTGTGGDIVMDSNASISYAGGVATDLTLAASRNVIVGATASINLSGAGHNLILNSGAEATSQAAVSGAIEIGGSITATAGKINLAGGSGGKFLAQGDGAGHDNGVLISGTIDAGSAALTIKGVGSPTATKTDANGVLISGGTIKAGDITIQGSGGALAGDGLGAGVKIADSNVKSTGSGSLSITGAAISTTGGQQGVLFAGTGAQTIQFGSGGLAIDGDAPLAPGGYDIMTTGGPTKFDGSGSMLMTADSLSIDPSNASFKTSKGDMTIQPSSGSVSVSVTNGAMPVTGGLLAISNQVLESIQVATKIGRSDLTTETKVVSGLVIPQDLTFFSGSGAITFEGPVNAKTVAGQSLTVQSTSGQATFPSPLGASTRLNELRIETNGLPVTLPYIDVDKLTIRAGGGDVTETSSIKVVTMADVDANTTTLTSTANSIGAIKALGGKATIIVDSSGTSLAGGTLTGDLAVKSTGALAITGAIAAKNIDLVTDKTIIGAPVMTTETLSIDAKGGDISTLLAGVSGKPAASLVNLRSGFITVNTVPLPILPTTPTTPTTPTVPTVPTTPTTPTVPTVPTIPTVPTVPTTPTTATTPTIPTTPPDVTSPTTPTTPSVPTTEPTAPSSPSTGSIPVFPVTPELPSNPSAPNRPTPPILSVIEPTQPLLTPVAFLSEDIPCMGFVKLVAREGLHYWPEEWDRECGGVERASTFEAKSPESLPNAQPKEEQDRPKATLRPIIPPLLFTLGDGVQLGASLSQLREQTKVSPSETRARDNPSDSQ